MPPEEVYEIFMQPPIERIEQRYTLDQVRYNAPLRDRMPRVDLDVNFETGSWQLSPEQVDRLAAIAEGIKRAIARNPREVFLVEGHTDAVGAAEDNLSLSDRRAEAVAVALTEQFQVPGGKPGDAGLRRTIPEGADRRTERGQPPRRGPPHHAADRSAGAEYSATAARPQALKRCRLD